MEVGRNNKRCSSLCLMTKADLVFGIEVELREGHPKLSTVRLTNEGRVDSHKRVKCLEN